jgi:GMP synthase (glutamine-hydrolysing)
MDVPLPSPDDATGFIITGSSSSVTERAPWMLRAEGLVRRLVALGVPLFGICFGHQLVAEALGGKVAKNPRGREIGTVVVRRTPSPRAVDDPLMAGLPATFTVNATHVDTVVTLPPGAHVLGETDLEPHAIYVVGETTKCVQFHPEIDGDAMLGYVEARAHLIEADGLDLAAIRSHVADTPGGAQTLANFVRWVTAVAAVAAGAARGAR